MKEQQLFWKGRERDLLEYGFSITNTIHKYYTTWQNMGDITVCVVEKNYGNCDNTALSRFNVIDLSKWNLTIAHEETRTHHYYIFKREWLGNPKDHPLSPYHHEETLEEAISNIDWSEAYEEMLEERGY